MGHVRQIRIAVDEQHVVVLDRVKIRRFATSDMAPSAALTRPPRDDQLANVDGLRKAGINIPDEPK